MYTYNVKNFFYDGILKSRIILCLLLVCTASRYIPVSFWRSPTVDKQINLPWEILSFVSLYKIRANNIIAFSSIIYIFAKIPHDLMVFCILRTIYSIISHRNLKLLKTWYQARRKIDYVLSIHLYLNHIRRIDIFI